jgi:hypothetical protein
MQTEIGVGHFEVALKGHGFRGFGKNSGRCRKTGFEARFERAGLLAAPKSRKIKTALAGHSALHRFSEEGLEIDV